MRTTRLLQSAVLLLVAASAAPAVAGCDYDPGTSAGTASHVFPRDDVFRPLLADPKEPRFYASYHRVNFRTGDVRAGRDTDVIHSGFIGAGENIGLWTRRAAASCDGVQISLFGGVFAQFDLSISSGDLINTDFLVGIPVSVRRGPWSFRGRLLHQSSHLGDEFLVRNRAIQVKNFGFEMLDALVSYDHGRLRAYGGLGVVFNSSTDFDPLAFQAGVEARVPWAPEWKLLGLVPTPVLGVDFKTWQQQDWDATWNAVAGLEFNRPGDNARLRLVGTLLHGHFPFAQFFDDTEVDAYGLAVQFEL